VVSGGNTYRPLDVPNKEETRVPKRLQLCFLVVFVAALSGYGAVSPDSPILGALGDTKGQVLVGGVLASTGATLVPGSVVATGTDSSAMLVVRGSEFAMHANTQVSMPTASQSIDLRQGTLLVKEQPSGNVRVAFPGAFVVIKGDSGSGALAEVATVGMSSKITVSHGLAEIHAAGAPMLLHAGQWARLDAAGSPPRAGDQSGASTGGPEAGKVTREVPHGTVDRQGKVTPLVLNDAIDWNDDVKTQDKGRLQITLTDGSVLSVGSRSEMKVVKHDAQTQQTDIELTSGTVKADVQKITKAGGHFEVHTATAVIGVVGTTFLVKSDSKGTTVCNTTQGGDGTAEVTITDSNGTQKQGLKSGFCAIFPLGGGAAAVLSASASASAISGLSAATVVAATAVAGAAIGISTGVVVAIVAAGAVGLSLGLVAATGGFSSSSTSP
jgi:ferric-dicitrate binding protein FerR (iron transport regulator)